MEEIKKILYDPKNNLFKPEEDQYIRIRIGNAFSSNHVKHKSNRDKEKSLSVKEYLYMIRPHLSGIIHDYKTQGEWEIHLTIVISFFSSKDCEKTHMMYSESDTIEVMIRSETDEIIEELVDSFLERYQKNLEESMRRSEFVFDSVNSLYYELHKISLNRGGPYTDSPKWLKNKKATINLKNNNKKCFQYAVAAALNYKQIKSHLERVSNIKLFIKQYNWKEINFPSDKKDWSEFEKNNKSIGLNILYVPYNTEEIRHA